jgi:hypothetical protein
MTAINSVEGVWLRSSRGRAQANAKLFAAAPAPPLSVTRQAVDLMEA